MFRRLTARANYMAQDRYGLLFPSKECARGMKAPNLTDVGRLKRMARYVKQVPREVQKFSFQPEVSYVDVEADTDAHGCPRTRKGTNGGACYLGLHAVPAWSTTQADRTTSSGHAEYLGQLKGASEGFGTQAVCADFGRRKELRLWTDSTAAKGMASRQGLGRM